MRTTWKTQTSVSLSKELVSNMTWHYYVFPRIQEFNCVSSDSSMEVIRIMTCTKEIEDTPLNPGKLIKDVTLERAAAADSCT